MYMDIWVLYKGVYSYCGGMWGIGYVLDQDIGAF